MINKIFGYKKIIGGSVIIIAAILTFVFMEKNKNLEAAGEGAVVTFDNFPGYMEAWGEVIYDKSEIINVDFLSAVTDVNVKEGEHVTLNQPLISIDMTEYTGSIEKLEKQLAASQLALEFASEDISALQAEIYELKNEISRKNEEYNNESGAEIKLLKSSLALAVTEMEKANIDYVNYKSLYEEGAVSQATFNQFSSLYDQRQKSVEDIKTNIDKTQTALKDELSKLNISLKSKEIQLARMQEGNMSSVAMNESNVLSLQTDLNIMKNKLEKSYIKGNDIVSDIKNGIIKHIAVERGDLLGIQGAPTEVLQIIDADSITVRVEVYEEFIKDVNVGDEVKIVPASDLDAVLKGKVTHIPQMAVEKDGRRIVRVVVEPYDSENALKPGFTADIYFER